ncbi:hypothetical protein IQ457_08185 [Psychrobacter sp. M9-54-1]|uniref:hypothetical protein n=1 Tax=Psychrobacter sp. M9-54-1 TaxID=2782386 RepID=UPI00190DD938|nr:hypothetical protein [Psychrobacter sp. M9-54-1]MBK3393913.1 hypothetical protein [Psychrobacter sp. M9-54-1]
MMSFLFVIAMLIIAMLIIAMLIIAMLIIAMLIIALLITAIFNIDKKTGSRPVRCYLFKRYFSNFAFTNCTF